MFKYLILFLLLAFGTEAANTPPPGNNGQYIINNNGQWGATTPPGGTPGGSSGQIQYNNAGSFGGLAINYNTVTTIPQSGYTPFGDDLTASSDSGGATTRYVNPLAASLGVAINHNYGTAGAMAADVSDTQVFSNAVPSATGNALYTVEVGANDALYKGAGTYETGVFKPSLKGALAWLSIPSTSKTYINFTNCSHTGTHWQQEGFAGGTVIFNNTAGETITCSVTTNGGTLLLFHQMNDNQASANFTYAVDGGSAVSANSHTTPATSTHNGGAQSDFAEEVDGLSNGTHSVVITIGAGGNFSLFIAFGTIPASFPSTSPIVFVSGVPYQFSNANSTNTSAYDADVTSVVTQLAGLGLPVYRMNARCIDTPTCSRLNSSTDMVSSIFLSNAGQSEEALGFLNAIQPIIGGTSGTAISPSSGGLGLNASALSGAVSFSGGAATVGNLGIGFGGTSASTSQNALNNLFSTSSGSTSAAEQIPSCTGSSDGSAILTTINNSESLRAPTVLPYGCLMTTGIQLTQGGFAQINGQNPSYQDVNNCCTASNVLALNNSAISTSATGSAAIDMHGSGSITLNGVQVRGNNNGVSMAFISNSVQQGGSGAPNQINLLNSGVNQVQVVAGCAGDDTLVCSQVGGVSHNGGTITPGSGYPIGSTFSNVPLLGGSGTGAVASTVTIGTTGAVASLGNFTGGLNYQVGDGLTVGTSSVGGTGSGFVFNVTSVLKASLNQLYFPNFINSGTGNYGTALNGKFSDSLVFGNHFGGGYGWTVFGQGNAGGNMYDHNYFDFVGGVNVPNGGVTTFSNNRFAAIHGTPSILQLGQLGSGGGSTAIIGNSGTFGQDNSTTTGFLFGGPSSSGEPYVSVMGNVLGVASNGPCIDIENGVNYFYAAGNVCTATTFGSWDKFGVVPPIYVIDDLNLHAESYSRPFGIGTSVPLGTASAMMDFEGTTSIRIPTGTTAQRPSSPVEGMLRDNTTLTQVEAYINGAWSGFFSNLNIGAGLSASSTTSVVGSVNSGSTIYADASYYPTFIGGLVASNDQATPNTIIDTSSGAATSDDNTTLMKLGSFTKTTGSWTVGSGNGCLDTGSVANSTWYHMFLVERTDTGVVDEICSTNASFPTLPTNYSKKRYAYSFLTDSSAHIVAFKSTPNGDNFYWTTPVLGFNDTGVTTTATLETLVGIPTGVKVRPICRVSMSKDSNSVLLTSPTEESDIAPSNANPMTAEPGQDITDTTIAAGVTNMVCPSLITNTAAQIRARSSASGTTVSTVIRGWEDTARHTPITQTLVLISGTTVVLPVSWNTASNQVWAIGEGGVGGTATSGGTGGGGGGGAIAGISNFSDSAGTSETIAIGTGGSATDTTFSSAAVLKAQHGSNGSVSSGGTGGTTGSSVGTIKHAGGAGGAGTSSSHLGAGGGGGAGGFYGTGAAGAANSSANGGGGGANGGGSVGSGTTGGNNVYSLGGALIGINGTVGGGGGGGNCCSSAVSHLGGTGGQGFEWSAFYGVGLGSGGGGGGGGGDNFGAGGGGGGGGGGSYGAGGGGGGGNGASGGAGGAGANGEIILIWTQP